MRISNGTSRCKLKEINSTRKKTLDRFDAHRWHGSWLAKTRDLVSLMVVSMSEKVKTISNVSTSWS